MGRYSNGKLCAENVFKIYSKVHENVLRILNWILKNKFLINKYVQIQIFYLFTHKFTYTICMFNKFQKTKFHSIRNQLQNNDGFFAVNNIKISQPA